MFKSVDSIKERYFLDDSYTYDKLLELYCILNEYKIIINYKYLFTDMKDKLSNKASLKNARATTLKKLFAEEKKLHKINGKQNKKPLFGKPKTDEKWIFDYKTSLNSIIDLYKELDTSNFDELIYTKLSQDSDLYEILRLITSNYLYFVNKTYEINEEEAISVINDKYEALKDYVNTNSFYLLDNICLLDEVQMKQLIVDKYNLEKVSLTIDSLLEENIDNTIAEINKLIEYENINNSGINLEDIALSLEYKKILAAEEDKAKQELEARKAEEEQELQKEEEQEKKEETKEEQPEEAKEEAPEEKEEKKEKTEEKEKDLEN